MNRTCLMVAFCEGVKTGGGKVRFPIVPRGAALKKGCRGTGRMEPGGGMKKEGRVYVGPAPGYARYWNEVGLDLVDVGP